VRRTIYFRQAVPDQTMPVVGSRPGGDGQGVRAKDGSVTYAAMGRTENTRA